MSAFVVRAWHYREAARVAHEARAVDRRGFFSIFEATAHRGTHPTGLFVWWHFRDFYRLGAKPGRMFDSRGHLVIALLMFAAICEDEEAEEEGQL